MKNRKGFTLIELLAVVVIIGILLLIAVPSVSKYLNKGTTKFYNSLEKSMVVSGREYLNDYQALLPKVIGNVTVIELNELTNNNYMDEVKDSNGNVCEGKITVKKIDKNQYDYYSCLICEDYQTEKENCEYSEDNNINNDTKNYTIEVEKDKYIVKQGEIFELPYAKAYYLGQLVSSTVSASPRIIDTNKLGTVTVTYAYEGVKKRITVEVIDASGPSIPQIVLKEDNENGKVYNGNWYKGNIYAEYKSTDYTKPGLNGSGIKEYQISQDGINYSSINSNNYTSSSNGEHSYYVRSVDNNGNISESNIYSLKIDKEIPKCELQSSGTQGSNGWYTSDVKLSFKSITEKVSSIKSQSIDNPTVTSDVKDKKVIGTVIDQAGNPGECQTTVSVDKTNPTVSYNVSGGNYSSNKTVTVTASDTYYSHMQIHVYKNGSIVNGDNNITSTTKSYNLTNGTWTIYTKAYDQSGRKQSKSPENNDGWYYQNYLIDTVAPTCSIKVTSGTQGSNGWYTSNVTVGWDKNDGTGSNIVASSISQTTITENGVTTVTATVTDEAGNIGACEPITIKKDDITPGVPTITASDNKASNTWHTSDFTLSYSGASNISGNTYYYGTNTNPTTSGTSTPINTNTTGTTYYVKVCSGAGLCSTNNSYVVKLDKTTPGIPTIAASDNKASNTWHTSDFTLSYSGASNISGNTYYYGTNTSPSTAGSSTPINTNTTGTTYYVKVCSGAGLCSTNNNYVAKLDKINPTVSYNVVAGTYNSNKTLTVTGSDTNFSYMNVHVYKNGSIVNGDNSITSTTKSYTLTHGSWTIYTKVYDQAGRKQSQSPENSDGWYYQSYLIDTVAPTCSLKVTSGTAGSNGWYTSNVTVGFNTTDGTGSNIASSSISQTTITAEGTTTVTGTVTDQAGHVGTCSKSISIEKTVSIPTITYNGGANSCSWKNNYNLTLSSSAKSGIAHYEIDWDNNGTVDTTTGNNFIPSNGYSSCSNRFRAVSNAGNRSNWTAAQHIHMDTEKPKHTNWWWGTVTKDKAPLYIQVSDNVGISKVQCPTSTATGGYTNWHWFGAVWDASANAYRCDITPATFGHYGQSYKTHLYIYDHAGNGGYYNQTSVTIPASCSLTAGQTWEFSYTGGEQPFTVPCSGTYKLEVYGAQGGSTPNLKYSWMGDVQGGKGGYATGNAKLTAGVLLNVVVGGQGSKAPELDKSSSGGYNGGGLGVSHYSTNASYYGSAGGGATHIATSKGLLSSLENNKESVLIVAGGGGGSVSHTDGTRPDGSKFDGGWHEGYGGGGLIGSQIDDNEYNTDSGKYAGKGGTQTAGGLDSIYIVDRNGLYASRFGQGGYLLKKYYEFEAYQGGSGGGGGGWYGGGACLDYNGAGGGSGHLHSSLTSGSMQNDVREGNGYAKITLVSID